MLNVQKASLVILHSTDTFLLYSTSLGSLHILPNMGEIEPDLSSIFSLIAGLYRLFQQSGLSLSRLHLFQKFSSSLPWWLCMSSPPDKPCSLIESTSAAYSIICLITEGEENDFSSKLWPSSDIAAFKLLLAATTAVSGDFKFPVLQFLACLNGAFLSCLFWSLGQFEAAISSEHCLWRLLAVGLMNLGSVLRESPKGPKGHVLEDGVKKLGNWTCRLSLLLLLPIGWWSGCLFLLVQRFMLCKRNAFLSSISASMVLILSCKLRHSSSWMLISL